MANQWRNVRVFISSTFRDMHAERNHLVREVFPALKKLCREKRIELTDVDLRWGVSESDAQDGKALDLCLNEIDTCRPFFLGLLGQRYGWVPDGQNRSITADEIHHGVLHNDLPRQVVDLRGIIEGRLEGRRLSNEQINCMRACYPWDGEKRKYVLRSGLSATDAGIIQGVFRYYAAYQRERSFFFFRQERLSRELAGNRQEDFFESDPDRKNQLDALKQEIMGQGLWWSNYDHIEPQDDDDLEAFGRKVKDVLWEHIQEQAAQQPPEERDWLDEEREFHYVFMEDRIRRPRFVGRDDDLKRLHDFREEPSSSPIMLVSGEPGCGKSALLARFAEQIQDKADSSWLVIYHFVGASPDSTNLRRSLRRWFGEINRHLGLDEEIPEDVRDLVNLFPSKLDQAAQAGSVLIILDAANQMEQADGAQEMGWLPANLMENIRLVVSTLEGTAKHALLARQPRTLEVQGLSPHDVKELVDQYLDDISKQFPNPRDMNVFLDKLSAGSPLYIIVALEELRLFGDFDAVSQRIADLPGDAPALFGQVLDRVENDFARFPGLVKDALCLMACGRQGMAPEELQALLDDHAPALADGSQPGKLPDMLMARLRIALDAYLFERSGALDFFHTQLKEAVGARWLSDQAQRDRWHQVIADYFEKRWDEPYLRALDELPHQLIKARDWDGVERVLCDLIFVDRKVASKLVYELNEDYRAALEALPENQENIGEERERQARLDKYARDLVAYAKGDIRELVGIPSINPCSEEELESERQRIIYQSNRMDRVNCLALWVSQNRHLLGSFGGEPNMCISLAESSFEVGPVALAAKRANEKIQRTTIFRPHPKWRKEFNQNTACLKTLGQVKNESILELSQDESVVAVTANGRFAVQHSGSSVFSTDLLRVWDIARGMCVVKLSALGSRKGALGISANGKLIVTIDNNNNDIMVWDLDQGKHNKISTDSSNRVDSVALTCDGERVILGCADGTLAVWDLKIGRCIVSLQEHDWVVSAIALSGDGRRVVSGDWSGNLMAWDLTGKSLLSSTFKYPGKIRDLAISLDGNLAVSCYERRKIILIWDIQSGYVQTIEGHSASVGAVAITADGSKVLAGCFDGTIWLWDLKSKYLLRKFHSELGPIDDLAIAPDGSRAVSAGLGELLAVWDLEKGGSESRTSDHYGHIYNVKISDDKQLLLSVGKNNKLGQDELKKWDLQSGTCLWTGELPLDTNVTSIKLSANNHRVACNATQHTRVWELKPAPNFLCAIIAPNVRFCMSEDGHIGVFENIDGGSLSVWDLDTGNFIRDINIIKSFPDARILSFYNDCQQILIIDKSKLCLMVLDLETGDCAKIIQGAFEDVFSSLFITGDQRYAINLHRSIEDENLLVKYDLDTGKKISTIKVDPDIESKIIGYTSGKLIYENSSSTIMIFNFETGDLICELRGHTKEIRHFRLIESVNKAVSSSKDGTLRIWDLSSGYCLSSLALGIQSVAALTDDLVVLIDKYGYIRILNLVY